MQVSSKGSYSRSQSSRTKETAEAARVAEQAKE